MGRKVAVIGAGSTTFKARWIDKTYYELAFDAAKAALDDAGLEPAQIESVVYGIYNELFERQFMPDVYIQDYLGLHLKPSVRVATGGATGGAAVRVGYMEVASGLSDVVMVLGVEKCNDNYDYRVGKTTPEVLRAIAYSADMTFEGPLGNLAASSYALPTVAHMERYGTPTEEQMALVSVKNHRNACNNPYAQSPKVLTVEDVLNSPKICYPFNFYDCCLYSEGASAVILASEERAWELSDKPVWITGVGCATDMAFCGNKSADPGEGTTWIWEFGSSRVAGQQAYRMAGISDPRQALDLAELHDAFTSAEILSYEAFGFCGAGEGGRLIEEGVTRMEGDLPVSPSGGLIGCGHAVGATGVMQVMEMTFQLRGEAGARQVRGARCGLVQSIGGPAAAWTVALILEA